MSIRRNPTRLSHIIDRVLKEEAMPAPSRLAMGGMHAAYALSESARSNTMNRSVPAHKVVGNHSAPGQVTTRDSAVRFDAAKGGHVSSVLVDDGLQANGEYTGSAIAKANHDMMDDMAGIETTVYPMTPCQNPACVCPNTGNTEISAHAYKPVHGGYPDAVRA